jgi:MoaA/NifB/PqqE/SkfB family radical SAM enzyme
MVRPAEIGRRIATRLTGRIHSLPILALNVHTACNCRCVMCDIWMANAQGRQMSADELDAHLAAIRRLRVQRVMVTGGEPLLHRNLWALCDRLNGEGIRITLVTTGLLIATHARDLAQYVDDLVLSIDGPPPVHDAIRRVPSAFTRLEQGLVRLRGEVRRPQITARCVVQRQNCALLLQTAQAICALGVDRLSFLAADVSSSAFNRLEPWPETRRSEVALSRDQLPLLAASIGEIETRGKSMLESGFIVGRADALWRIHEYYAALSGDGAFPASNCNAPWISAVLEPDGQLRPCFFHHAYAAVDNAEMDDVINSPSAIAFRRALDMSSNPTCKRCVCTLSLAPWTQV